MSPNAIMNHWSSRLSITATRQIKEWQSSVKFFILPETKSSQYKVNTFPPAELVKIYTPNMQIVPNVSDEGKHLVSQINNRQVI
jgi:hypothetical protein